MNGKNEPELQPLIEAAEQKLKPCPFCGGIAEMENTHTPSYWVECTDCNCQVGDQMSHELYDDIPTHKMSIQNACNAWNTRVSVAKAKRQMLL